jgi:hypothetical protein
VIPFELPICDRRSTIPCPLSGCQQVQLTRAPHLGIPAVFRFEARCS